MKGIIQGSIIGGIKWDARRVFLRVQGLGIMMGFPTVRGTLLGVPIVP